MKFLIPAISLLPLTMGCAAAMAEVPAAPSCTRIDEAEAVKIASGFLDAYARGEEAAVIAALAPDVTAYGTDVSEVFRGPAGVVQMLTLDQKLWRGSASFGAPADISLVPGCGMAALTFHRPFLIPGRPPVTVRFNMVLRESSGRWLLAQSANAVPTVKQSAADLLKQ